MAEIKKIEDKELESVKEQTNKIQRCILDIGSLEVKKVEVMQAYEAFLKDLEVTKKELEEKYGSVNINLTDGSYEEVKAEDKTEEK
tara:strand:- start:590 stop:847 length:258 start_codon:yes stop_codon:yes gene_type:complete